MKISLQKTSPSIPLLLKERDFENNAKSNFLSL
jgi:hypothetical protein